ncbi:MAG: DNA-processing protein DprA [Thermodesulfobacteriota bacterium]
MPLLDWLTLALTPGCGPATARRLLAHLGETGAACATPEALAGIPGLRDEVRRHLSDPAIRQQAQKELERCEKAGVQLIAWDDPRYPALLKEIANPPMVLHVKGDAGLLAVPALAVVGARAATAYGQKIAGEISAGLARHGFTVVSGLALGIDGAAHRSVLTTGGKTIAVLGCGVDLPYPSQHRGLYEAIADQGALVSDYPLGTPPEGFRFPARNRIISGLCRGVVVIEAARHSGSLITAELAMEQGREVFAVPGRIDSAKSEGCHRLIREGATLVHSVADILAELDYPAPAPSPQAPPALPLNLSPEEQTIVACLEAYPKDIDAIITTTRLSAQKVATLLLGLELKGLVTAHPGQQYQRLGATP